MKTLQRFLSLSAAVVLAVTFSAATASAAVDYYLKIDGINGESQAEGFAGEIDVESFKAGVQQRGISDFGGGAAAGKSEFMPLRIIKFVDAATPQLFVACATGKRFPKATLTAVRLGEEPFAFLKITLSDVLISSVNQEPGDNDGTNILLESVALNFSRIEISYTPQNPDGSAGTPVRTSFDVKRNAVPR